MSSIDMRGILDITEDVHFSPVSLGSAAIREDTQGSINTVPGDILFVDVAAVHAERISRNFRLFTRECLEGSVVEWTRNFPKPVLFSHNVEQDPIGRVVTAAVEEESGSIFHRLTLGIIDATAIQKILDGRYLTGSVGGKAVDVKCSICQHYLVKDNIISEKSCKHLPGESYRGKVAHLVYENARWVEYSFVNVPADPLSKKLSTRQGSGAILQGEEKYDYVPSYYFMPSKEEKVLAFTEDETLSIEVSEGDAVENGIYMGFRELADRLLDTARLEVTVDSADPDAMEVIQGVPSTTTEGHEVTADDIFEICKDIQDMLQSKPEEAEPEEGEVEEAKWNAAFVNSLPDIAFALIKRPVKDKASDRALPHHGKGVKSASDNGSVDKAHLSNALARVNQVKGFTSEAKSRAVGHLKKHASALGIGEEEVEELLEKGEEALTDEDKAYWENLMDELHSEESQEEPESTEEQEQETEPETTEEGQTELEEDETSETEPEESAPTTAEGEEDQAEKESVPGEEDVAEGNTEATEEGGEPAEEKSADEPDSEESEESDTKETEETEESKDEEEVPEEEEEPDHETMVQELRNENERLENENLALRSQLHFFLAEKVVDEMVKRGQIREEERHEQLEEHLTRTPVSLKDKLRDLLGLRTTKQDEPPEMERESTPVETKSKQDEVEEDAEESDEGSKEEPISPDEAYERLFSSLLGEAYSFEDYLNLE